MKNDRQSKLKLIAKHTTTVKVSDTLAEINKLLLEAGCTNVHMEMDNGKVVSVVFGIPIQPDGRILVVKLPANPQAVSRKILSTYDKKQHDSERRANELAERISWRLVLDQLKLTITQIQLEQMDARQAWMGQIYDPHTKTTFFEKAMETGLLLSDGK